MSAWSHDVGAPVPLCRTILVVDDSPVALHFFALVLRQAGYRVLEASHVHEAQRLASGGLCVDLLLTDFQMPVMNGVELAVWFRERMPSLPVLLVTGSPELAVAHAQYVPTFVCRPKMWQSKELVDTVVQILASAP